MDIRSKILDMARERGAIGVQQIVRETPIGATAVRDHIRRLVQTGYLQPARQRYRYEVSDTAPSQPPPRDYYGSPEINIDIVIKHLLRYQPCDVMTVFRAIDADCGRLCHEEGPRQIRKILLDNPESFVVYDIYWRVRGL